MVWQRIESYVAYRWTPRAVTWIVEGCGEWYPPLALGDRFHRRGVERCERVGGFHIGRRAARRLLVAGDSGPYRVHRASSAAARPAPIVPALPRKPF